MSCAQQCGVSRDGSKASNVLKAARQHGLEARGFRKEPGELRALPMPVIVHWNFNHFLVVEGFGKDSVYLNDPATGRRTVTAEEFDRAFTGVVLTFSPTDEFEPAGTRPRAGAVAARAAARRAGRGGVPGAGRAGAGVPRAGGPGVRPGVRRRGAGRRQRDWLAALLVGMAATALVRAALTWLQQRYLLRLLMRLAVGMSSTFLWHVLRLPMAFFAARSPATSPAACSSTTRSATCCPGAWPASVLDLVLVVFYAALMAFYDPWLTAIGRRRGGAARHRCWSSQQRGRTDEQLRVSVEDRQAGRRSPRRAADDRDAQGDGRRVGFFARWAGHQAKLARRSSGWRRRDQIVGALAERYRALNTLLVLGVGALRVMDGQLRSACWSRSRR